MKATIIGTGYVGLVTGACLAELGNEIMCLDTDPRKIETLQNGGIHIYEPKLLEMVQRNVIAKRLFFTTDIKESVIFGDIQFISVGTPPDENGSADLQYVITAARNIAMHMQNFKLVVDKSTVPVGTADKVKAAIRDVLTKRRVDIDFSVVSNPEFLKEGAAIEDFMRPDRIVIGTESDKAAELLRQLYLPFQRNHERLITMDVRSAELTKYAANAMLATRISFMNELALLAEKLGADIDSVRRGIGSDSRIGYDFLYAGCGYGGSCLPKDVQALLCTAAEVGQPMSVLNAVADANENQKTVMLDKITTRFGNNLKGMRFAVWGLAFKPNTDDMREAPSHIILKGLWERGAMVCAYDPAAMEETLRIYGKRADLQFVDSPMDALKGVDALVIITEWKEFRSPSFDDMKNLMKTPTIFDGRNLYQTEVLRDAGFNYLSIGRS
jgi:UDPglucose 6-dehydrogenase